MPKGVEHLPFWNFTARLVQKCRSAPCDITLSLALVQNIGLVTSLLAGRRLTYKQLTGKLGYTPA